MDIMDKALVKAIMMAVLRTTEFPISSKAEIRRVYFRNLLPAGRLVLVSILPSARSLLLNLFTNNLCFRADGNSEKDMRAHKLVCLNEIRDRLAVCRPACTWDMVIISELCVH